MSYKVLARKWRPQRFEDMLGQAPVLRALVNALDSGRLHHAYLFTGMRGVGKTTIARIFAKCLNCLDNGVSSTPCGQCSVCRDIEAGRFLDLIEVDAASRTKVEETRELLENVPYAPAVGRYKVYLIDEVHMFSTSSFNALLKTLEEPPEHVKFLLATTDPQKVPVTVLSRCLQFNLRRMAPAALADYLSSILERESIPAERAALELIARASEGSVRDSLSLVEQATAFGEGRVRATEVESMLGRVSVTRLLGLLDALGEGDVQLLFERVEAMAVHAPDFTELLGEMLTLLHRLALLQSVPGSSDASQPGFEALSALATRLAPEDVQLWYQILQHARRDLPYAPDPREAFDMALLRLHAFRPQRAGGEGAVSVSVSNAVVAPAPAAGVGAAPAAVPAVGPAPVPAVVPAPVAASAPVPVAAPAPAPAPAPVAAPVAASGAGIGAPGSLEAIVPEAWSGIVEQLGLSGMPRQLATHSAIQGRDGTRLRLVLEAAQDHLAGPRFVDRVATALSTWAGETITLDVTLADGSVQTPARQQQLGEEEAVAGARRSIAEDAKLQRLLADVEGSVDEDSVRPLDPPSR